MEKKKAAPYTPLSDPCIERLTGNMLMNFRWQTHCRGLHRSRQVVRKSKPEQDKPTRMLPLASALLRTRPTSTRSVITNSRPASGVIQDGEYLVGASFRPESREIHEREHKQGSYGRAEKHSNGLVGSRDRFQ